MTQDNFLGEESRGKALFDIAELKTPKSLFLQDGVVAIADQLAAHEFGIFDVRVRSNLHVDEFVGRRVGGECGILFLLERIDQSRRVFGFADCGNLHEVAVRRRRSQQGRESCLRWRQARLASDAGVEASLAAGWLFPSLVATVL